MECELFNAMKDVYHRMCQLRDRNDEKEPIGYIEHTNEEIIMAYMMSDLNEPLSVKETRRQIIADKRHVWHGHPNGYFPYEKENPVINRTEDGNPNKPSYPDLVQLITHPFETYTIAVPDGIIVLEKTKNNLTRFLELYLNKVGTALPHIFDNFATCVLYCVMSRSGIRKYSAENWIDGVNSLGLDVRFYPVEEIHEPNKQLNDKCHRTDIRKIEQLFGYTQSKEFEKDIRKTTTKLHN